MAAAVVGAVQAYSKINSSGQSVDRSEHVTLNELFERMTKQELEDYAQSGALPAWFTSTAEGPTTNEQQPIEPGITQSTYQRLFATATHKRKQ